MATLADIWADLASTVVTPTKVWLKKRRYWQRVLILLLPVVCVFAYTNRAILITQASFLLQVGRIAFADNKIPLRHSTQERIAALAGRIETQAKADLRADLRRGTTLDSGWASAQLIFALKERGVAIGNDADEIAAFLRAQRVPGNIYWGKKSDPPHMPSTAWSLRALACLKVPATQAELQYVLAQQGQDGGWPLFVGSLPKQESVFATALMITALTDQLSLPHHSQDTRDNLQAAVDRAAGWLVQNGDRERARWKFYPLVADSSESESDSGLVLYALARHSADDHADTHKDLSQGWLRSLPAVFPKRVPDMEMSGEWFEIGAISTIDHVRHLKLPWLIIGTVVSYHHGDLRDRVRASRVLEDAVERQDWGVGGTWTFQRAEILIALTALQKRSH